MQVGGIGVIRNPATGTHYTALEAFNLFTTLVNEVSLISHGSISAVVIKLSIARANEHLSPYYHIRQGYIFKTPVKSILVKILTECYTGPPNLHIGARSNRQELHLPYVRNRPFEAATERSVVEEVKIQTEVYCNGLSNRHHTVLDPICPSVLYCGPLVQLEYWNRATQTMWSPVGGKRVDEPSGTDKQLLLNYLASPTNKFIIVMELLEGYMTIKSATQQYPGYKDRILAMAAFPLHILHNYGYNHNDYHSENCMINLNIAYFTNDVGYVGHNPNYMGKPMMIDLGRVDKKTQAELRIWGTAISYDQQMQLINRDTGGVFGPRGAMRSAGSYMPTGTDLSGLWAGRTAMNSNFVSLMRASGYDINVSNFYVAILGTVMRLVGGYLRHKNNKKRRKTAKVYKGGAQSTYIDALSGNLDEEMNISIKSYYVKNNPVLFKDMKFSDDYEKIEPLTPDQIKYKNGLEDIITAEVNLDVNQLTNFATSKSPTVNLVPKLRSGGFDFRTVDQNNSEIPRYSVLSAYGGKTRKMTKRKNKKK